MDYIFVFLTLSVFFSHFEQKAVKRAKSSSMHTPKKKLNDTKTTNNLFCNPKIIYHNKERNEKIKEFLNVVSFHFVMFICSVLYECVIYTENDETIIDKNHLNGFIFVHF